MNFHFTYNRYKFTNDFFFKTIQKGTVKIYDSKFEIDIFPFFRYSGTYHIIKSQEQGNGVLNYVVQEQNGYIPEPSPINIMFIHISKDGSMFKVYDRNMVGIILKF